ALAITEPVPESVARVMALVDDVVLVDDDDLRAAMELIAESLGLLVEPAGGGGDRDLVSPSREGSRRARCCPPDRFGRCTWSQVPTLAIGLMHLRRSAQYELAQVRALSPSTSTTPRQAQ